jgi:hypothetical protein
MPVFWHLPPKRLKVSDASWLRSVRTGIYTEHTTSPCLQRRRLWWRSLAGSVIITPSGCTSSLSTVDKHCIIMRRLALCPDRHWAEPVLELSIPPEEPSRLIYCLFTETSLTHVDFQFWNRAWDRKKYISASEQYQRHGVHWRHTTETTIVHLVKLQDAA